MQSTPTARMNAYERPTTSAVRLAKRRNQSFTTRPSAMLFDEPARSTLSSLDPSDPKSTQRSQIVEMDRQRSLGDTVSYRDPDVATRVAIRRPSIRRYVRRS